jgi:hypothetical protein
MLIINNRFLSFYDYNFLLVKEKISQLLMPGSSTSVSFSLLSFQREKNRRWEPAVIIIFFLKSLGRLKKEDSTSSGQHLLLFLPLLRGKGDKMLPGGTRLILRVPFLLLHSSGKKKVGTLGINLMNVSLA